MPFLVIWMSCMVEYGDDPLSGMGMSGDSVVKAFSNWLFNMFALSVVSLVSIPSLRRAEIPELSVFMPLM